MQVTDTKTSGVRLEVFSLLDDCVVRLESEAWTVTIDVRFATAKYNRRTTSFS
jgi:hypothetical protein